MSEVWRVIAVLGLVLGNAVFVAAEYALVTARRSRLEERARKGGRSAQTALRLMDDPVRFISTVQVAITVFAIALGAVGEPLISGLIDWLPRGAAFAIAFTLLTYLSVTFGELVPKAVALQKAEGIAVALAIPLDVFARVVYPVVWLLQVTANAVLRLLRVTPAPAGMIAFTREDIRQSVAVAEDVGEIQTAEEEMLYKVFDFAEKEASDVMVPRPDLVALSVAMPPEKALQTVLESPYTRYPVYRESLDEILGILHVRDLFGALLDRGIERVEVADLLRPAYFVPETKDLAALLGEFRRTNQHLAVVVDEYGSTMGIVTLEDVLEEIVGDIEDEFDLPNTSVEHVDERTIRVDGTYSIDDFNEDFGTSLEHEDFHTLAGYVFHLLGRAAEQGDEVRDNGLRFTVLEVGGTRIHRLEIEFTPAPATPGTGEHEPA